jgi:hypothetical protein
VKRASTKVRLFEAQSRGARGVGQRRAGFGFELQDELMLRELNLGPAA